MDKGKRMCTRKDKPVSRTKTQHVVADFFFFWFVLGGFFTLSPSPRDVIAAFKRLFFSYLFLLLHMYRRVSFA